MGPEPIINGRMYSVPCDVYVYTYTHRYKCIRIRIRIETYIHTDSACVRVCVYMTKHFSTYVHKKNLDVDRHLCVGGTNLAKWRDPRCVGEDVVGVLPEVGEHEVDVRMTQGATV